MTPSYLKHYIGTFFSDVGHVMTGTMEQTDAYMRVPHLYDDDISYSSGDDNDSDYGADNEDNDDYPDEDIIPKDPGPFRYNRKLFVVSLPCALMVLSLVGEM